MRYGQQGDTLLRHGYNPVTRAFASITAFANPEIFGPPPQGWMYYRAMHEKRYLMHVLRTRVSLADTATPADIEYPYAQVELLDTLQGQCPYYFEAYVLAVAKSFWDEFSRLDFQGPNYSSQLFTTRSFGFHFGTERILDSLTDHGHEILNRGLQPQITLGRFLRDTNHYHLIQGQFTASGGEKFLTIGIFDSLNGQSVYYFRDSSIRTIPDTSFPWFHSHFYTDSLSLTALPADFSELVILGDTTFCQGDSLRVEAQMSGGRQWQWRDGPRSPVRYLSQPGTYYLEALDPCGYRHRDSITLRYPETLGALPGGDTSLCAGEQVVLNLNPELHYRLNGQVVSGQLALTAPAQYRWEISNGCDTLRQNWHYAQKQMPALPPPGLVPDTSLCPPNIWVLPLPDSAYQYRLDGQRRSLPIAVNQPGNYRLSVSQACDSAEYAFRVGQESCAPELFIAKAFSPNGDGLNDRFSLKGEQPDEFEIRIFNRWGQQVFYSRDFSESWEGRYRDEAVSGTFQYKVYYQLRGYEIFRTGVVRVLR